MIPFWIAVIAQEVPLAVTGVPLVYTATVPPRSGRVNVRLAVMPDASKEAVNLPGFTMFMRPVVLVVGALPEATSPLSTGQAAAGNVWVRIFPCVVPPTKR